MSLKDDVLAMQKEVMPKIPEATLKTMMAATESLIQSGLAEKAKKKRDQAPSFYLSNTRGTIISSDDLLKQGPLVINFYRGAWCPYCNLELKAFQNAYENIKAQGASLVSISPNLIEKTKEFTSENPFDFDFLSDPNNKIARKFGLVFRLDDSLIPIYKQFGIDLPSFDGNESYEIPIPATYIIKPDGIILHAFVNADYTQRMEPEEIVKILKENKMTR